MRAADIVTASAALGLLCIGAPGRCPGGSCGDWRRPRPAGSATTTITRSAHVPFENCSAQHIVLSVTIPRHAFTPAEPVTYTVRLRNTGSTACGARLQRQAPPFRQALIVGPCGSLSATVRNARGVAVYPGPVYYNCPLLTSFQLGPHATASATGTWTQSELLGPGATPRHAPPGTYRLVVDRAVTVPVTLAPG